MPKGQLELPDGTILPLIEVSFHYDWNLTVSLDDNVLPLGLAFRTLLTWRHWAQQEIERLEGELERLHTTIADLKSHEDNCPVAQQEAKDRE